MDVNAIIDGIIDKKAEVGMTNQQISDASQVPRTTINRILAKQTPNPSMQSVMDIAHAVGYVIEPENPPTLQEAPSEAHIALLEGTLELERRQAERRQVQMRAHYNMLLAEKNRWIKHLFVLTIILVTALVAFLVLDILHPDLGWVRRTAATVIGFFDKIKMCPIWTH